MDRLEDHTGFLLKAAYTRAAGVAATLFPPGSHPRDAAVLAMLATAGPISQQQLAGDLSVNRTVMVKLIDSLERRGLVERRRNPADRRSYALVATDAGRSGLAALAEPLDRAEATFTAALSDAERARLHELLGALVAPAPPELAGRSGYLVARAHHRFREAADTVVRPLGIEVRHYGALTALAGGVPSQRELADRLGVSTPVIVEMVDALEALGLVARRRDPADRRSNNLHVTEAGRATLAAAVTKLTAVVAELTRPIGAAGDAELRALLRKLLGYA